MRPLIPAFVLMAALAGPAMAKDVVVGNLTLSDASARASLGKAPNSAAYLTIRNSGKADDTLTGAECACATKVEIHDMTHEGGVMRMFEIPGGLKVPAGQTVKLARGGKHIMLFGLKAPLKAGTQQPITLIFEKAGRVKVTFPVQDLSASPAKAPAGGAHHGH